MTVCGVAEQTFNGVGRTKKQAKQNAAQTALHSCVQFRHPVQVQRYVDEDERRRRGVMAAEDFTTDDVHDIQPDLNFNHLNKSALLNSPDKSTKKFQSESYQFVFFTRKFSTDGPEDRSKASSLDILFNQVGGYSTLDFPDGGNEELQSRCLGYSPWPRQLNAGLLKDWSTPSDIDEVLPDHHHSASSSTQRRWWNPVAVLSDLRPNIQYHRNTASDAANEDAGLGRRTLHCRRDSLVTVTAVVDGRQFQARGRTVKQAKRRLAADVLSSLFRFQFIGQKPRLPLNRVMST